MPAAEAEVVADALWQLGASAVEERQHGDRVALVADVDPSGLGGRWLAAPLAVDDGWWDVWRPFARAVRAGRRLVVQPPWAERIAGPGDVVVEVDPGRAWGSGSHESTRLALAALEGAVHPGDRVLDVGCGSGVLAVAAALLGVVHVDATDVDHAALEAAPANARRNGVADRVRVVAEPDGCYDVVVANLDLPVLLNLAGSLADRVGAGGTLVASGFLSERLPEVTRALAGLEVTEVAIEEGWAAVVLHA